MNKKVSLVRCELVKEKSITYEFNQEISSSETAAKIVKDLIGNSDREKFVVLFLDTRYKIIGLEIVAVGQIDQVAIHPREVFKAAIISNSKAIILAHNHPSGDSTPSQDDIALTKRMMQAGEILAIEILDHIVVGDNVTSLRETTSLWIW